MRIFLHLFNLHFIVEKFRAIHSQKINFLLFEIIIFEIKNLEFREKDRSFGLYDRASTCACRQERTSEDGKLTFVSSSEARAFYKRN